MKAVIDYRADRDLFFVYMGGQGYSIIVDSAGARSSDRKIRVHPNPGDEHAVFMELSHEEYLALSAAIIERESPHLAEASLYKEMMNDTREVRDRMISLLEQG